MYIEISKLHTVYFEFTNLFVSRQRAQGKTSFVMQEPRPTDALVLFSGTTGICYQEGKEPIYVPKGGMVYLPKNCRYMWENSAASEDGLQENLLFEFRLRCARVQRGDTQKREMSWEAEEEYISLGEQVSVITTKHSQLYRELFLQLIDAFYQKPEAPLNVFCAAYEIFRTLSEKCRMEEESVVDVTLIKPGIEHLEQYGNNEKSMKEIADMCGVSISYFERLFKKYTGTTPIEYVNSRKIYQIKMMLQDDRMNLDQIAEKAGYCDSGYLCRVFKKQTGMTPGEYKKITLAGREA